MKTLNRHGALLLLAMFAFTPFAHGQLLKKLGKRAERAVERTVENRVDREASKKTDAALDSILEPGSKEQKPGPKEKTSPIGTEGVKNPSLEEAEEKPSQRNGLEEEGENEVGFKRGGLILYTDDFSQDAIGDFPAKWNTSLGGEVKKLKGFESKYLKVPANSVISLETTKPFPDNFTVEMDIIIPEDAPIRMAVIGLGKTAPPKVDYMLTHEDDIRLYFESRADHDTNILKYGTDNGSLGYTYHSVDYKAPLNQQIHVAFEINGRRIRMFVDGKKVVDLPTIYKSEFSNSFYVSAPIHGDERSLQNYFYISNVVIAETGTDLRSSVMKDLIEKGNFTTSDIRFASGSDKIEPSSKDILDQIGDAMQSNREMKFMIIGHTDSDGEESANVLLSKKRAAAVKTYLVSNFTIDATNLQTDGKGENSPMTDNTTIEGKAQNRRVEFIKM